MTQDLSRRTPAGVHPPNLSPEYKSTPLRAPSLAPIALPQSLSEITGPLLTSERLDALENDLTKQRSGEPLGERIVVHGRVLDENDKAVPGAMVEIWQCNAAGRYHHPGDQHDAPLDPNFYGGGRCRADAEGRYQFITIKPGAYPWKNHHNAWRPAHIHFSLFGPAVCRGPMAAGWASCRRRTSTSPSSPAACSIAWRRGSISTATRRWPRIRC